MVVETCSVEVTRFPDQPLIRPIALTDEDRKKHKRRWLYRLENDFAYEWAEGDERLMIVVPAGLLLDGASIPRPAWTISGLTPDGLIRAGACIHDYLYRHQGKLPHGSLLRLGACQFVRGNEGEAWAPLDRAFSREESDQLFRRILRESNIRGSQVWLAYQGVRVGGGGAWKRAVEVYGAAV